MTPTEWADTLDVIYNLWPAMSRWPDKSADRCYRQLKGFNHSTIIEAVAALRGEYPPSPASLEVKVAELAAAEARYSDPYVLHPDVYEAEKTRAKAEQIRGGKSWGEYLEDSKR